MAFCPFYNLQCPETNEGATGCKIWTDFGCCMIDKPGIPCEYSGVSPSVDVFILRMFSSNAKVAGDFLIVYALASDGTIAFEDDITKFAVHRLY